MDKLELEKIVLKHGKWVKEEAGGERANLNGAHLKRAKLSGAHLRCVNLSYADMRRANLCSDLRFIPIIYSGYPHLSSILVRLINLLIYKY